jgi:hypothetical protein
MSKHTTTHEKKGQKNTIIRNTIANNKTRWKMKICAWLEEGKKKNGCNRRGERERRQGQSSKTLRKKKANLR